MASNVTIGIVHFSGNVVKQDNVDMPSLSFLTFRKLGKYVPIDTDCQKIPGIGAAKPDARFAHPLTFQQE